MIDLHCHILPGLDDGAESLVMTVEMARLAQQTGTTQIVCTPHCTASDHALPERIAAIRRLVSRINLLLEESRIPLTLRPGMELLCLDGLLPVLEDGTLLTLADSRYLLIEFDFDAPISHMERAIRMVTDFRLRPVLAHPERYPAIQQDPRQIGTWFQRGCLVQIDKGSILGRFGQRPAAAADWILGNGLAHIVASDAHRSNFRTPDLSRVYRVVSERYSGAYADILFEKNPARILDNRDIVRPDEI